jgi:hypothetical protein
MIKKAVLLALGEGVIGPEDLYWLDDAQLSSLAERHSFAPLELVGMVGRRQLYKLAAAMPFEAGNPLHLRLQDVRSRLLFERELCTQISTRLGRTFAEQSLIIDVPEPINFEIDLPVVDGEGGETTVYERSRSVFNRDSVSAFTHSLRTISLFVEAGEELSAVLPPSDARRILEQGLG